MSDPRIEEHKKKVDEKHKAWAIEVTLWVRGLMNANYWRNKVYYGDGMDATKAAMIQTMDDLKNQQAVNRYAFGELGYIDANGPWNSGGGCWITQIQFHTFVLSIGIENIFLTLRKHNEQCSTKEGWEQYLADVDGGEIEPDECYEWGGMK